jgi:DNA processing protein
VTGRSGTTVGRRPAVGCTTIARGDAAYPALLAAIFDPPERLYLRGAGQRLLDGPCVAVVGSRACSSYGAGVAESVSRALAAAGVVVVSGLARGVDAAAHRGALAAGGATLAVLGCGIDRDYPASNAGLARRIAESGLIVSEYPPGVEPAPWRFPARNRIVAGLAVATVVVEARERSGALITADFALEEGREVFAVPGPITAGTSAGSNGLLRLGAAPLLEPADVLSPLGLDVAPRPSPTGELAAAVLEALRERPAGTDELAGLTNASVERVAAALVELELDGLITCGEGVYRPG